MTCRPRLYMLALIASCVAAACGSESPSSPTAPSARSGSNGAVIMGRVTGPSVAATTAGSFTTMAESRLTVTIVGTNISTTVNGNGQFTLNGVPPGDVRLRFSGNGVDATIMLAGVTAADRITITVSLNGNTARLESENRDHDEDDEEDENEVQGAVSNLSGGCPTLTFTVQSTTVKTNNATKFQDGPCARVANGTRVEAEGKRQADRSILATKVEIKR